MPYFSWLQDHHGIQDVMRLDRDRFGPLGKSAQNIMRRKSELSIADREMLGAYVSGLNQCGFCHNVHVEFAKGHGIDPDIYVPLFDDLDAAPIDDKLKPIFRYCKKLTETPYKLTQADYDAVIHAGWNENTLSDAVAVTALFNFFNRIVEGHGIVPPTEEKLAAQSHIMVNAGYDPRSIVTYILKWKLKEGWNRLIGRTPKAADRSTPASSS